jgi:hypothetical protein
MMHTLCTIQDTVPYPHYVGSTSKQVPAGTIYYGIAVIQGTHADSVSSHSLAFTYRKSRIISLSHYKARQATVINICHFNTLNSLLSISSCYKMTPLVIYFMPICIAPRNLVWFKSTHHNTSPATRHKHAPHLIS